MCMVYMSALNNVANCVIIPCHLKCIMRSSEVSLISLCLMASVNFSQLWENPCNVKDTSPYLELRSGLQSACDHLNTVCDCWWPFDSGKICCGCANFVEYRAFLVSQHPYHNYIHHIRGHNPSCNSKHGAYWSDPLLLNINYLWPLYLFQLILRLCLYILPLLLRIIQSIYILHANSFIQWTSLQDYHHLCFLLANCCWASGVSFSFVLATLILPDYRWHALYENDDRYGE